MKIHFELILKQGPVKNTNNFNDGSKIKTSRVGKRIFLGEWWIAINQIVVDSSLYFVPQGWISLLLPK